MRILNLFQALTAACSIAFLSVSSGISADLTPEQVASIKAQIKEMKESLDKHITSRNSGAGDIFLRASASPKEAVDLYMKCVKLVNYEQKDLKESDFRLWKEKQASRFQGDKFPQSLQMLLRYLAISCRAAEVEKIDEVFVPLTSYVNSLSQMEELPDKIMTTSVANSVFAQAYHLEDLLGKNKSWEKVPINIGGIYTKTIFPYLRSEKPEGLMAAWDRRIEQETRLVAYFDKEKQKVMRGKTPEEKKKMRDNLWKAGESQMNTMGYSKDRFTRETLPKLKWNKLKDMYNSIDQEAGAKAMLDYVRSNLNTPLGKTFYQEFISLINSAGKTEETPVEKIPAN